MTALLASFGIILLIVSSGVAVSIRHGTAGRRISAGLVILLVVALNVPGVGERSPDWEATAITSLRAINAAQLMYSTTVGSGAYAGSLNELAQAGLLTLNEGLERRYELRLIPGGASYAVTAVPRVNTSAGAPSSTRSFCVDDRGSIFYTQGRTVPAIRNGRCGDTLKSIQ